MKICLASVLSLIMLFGCTETSKKQKTVAVCAPVVTDNHWYTSDNVAPLFEGMGELDYPISTKNKLVQQYFNQGLVLAYGFNHAEAARSFHYASKLDTSSAMSYWGFAYVLGPNYNAGMEADNYERAHLAIQKAMELSENGTSTKEKALIMALAKRYVKEPIEDRSSLDFAYSLAMKEVYEKFPKDANIATLYAESIMDLHPWDLWDANNEPKEWTVTIIKLLEEAIAIDPKHPGAHHFYIHALETSSQPEKALKSAELFDQGLVPNAGHLVHMPSHIYIRTGDYHKGTLSNIQAIAVDSTYVTACHAQGAYPLSYFPHNQHFMAATATLEGNSKMALYAADAVSENANLMLMKEPGWGTIQHYYTIPYYVYVKFGKWDDILQMENKAADLDYPRAMEHYAKGMAYLGKGNNSKAEIELNALKKIAGMQSLKEVTIWDINSVYDLVQIAQHVLHGELLKKQAHYNESIEEFNKAIIIEDNLNYNEPPDWFFSVRHNLGAVQIKASLENEAVLTYLEDLKRLPKNGWALNGLALAYKKLNNETASLEASERFNTAWATADIDLVASVAK